MIELVNLAGAGAPTKRISKKEIQQAMQVGAGAPTKRISKKKFNKQCKLGLLKKGLPELKLIT
ncbi:hypothetical protein WL514_00270 [Staphylococcus saprophyticus]